MLKIYRNLKGQHSLQECFYVDTVRALMPREVERLLWLLSAPGYELKMGPAFPDKDVVEIGPRLAVETPFSSNAVAICHSLTLPIARIEMSRRYQNGGTHLDPMTEQVYESSPNSFESGFMPAPVGTIPILERGEEAMREANKQLGLGMDEWDMVHWTAFFVHLGRNPTDVELFQIGNGNSEHSRHWFFKGRHVIDGVQMPETLMDIVKEPHKKNPGIRLVAFHDNAGVIRGFPVDMLVPVHPGKPSAFTVRRVLMHLSATAETHNHPTLIAPFPGAETGVGGRIRDSYAVGQGGMASAGVAGYCVGNLHSGLDIPGEMIGGEVVRRHASPLDILIQGSNGVSDYANKIGEPLLGGFCRSFGQMVNGVRREFRKPVLYSGGIANVLDMHFQKKSPEQGMLIVRIGGPAYRIGVGGGSASSMVHGSQSAELDFQSVQRGDAQMENRVVRVIRACIELFEKNPIESIHDQGAGGPSNVLTELMDPQGGRVDIRKLTVGDQTMSVLELWVAEFQEGFGLLVRPENIEVLQGICARERVNCEVWGEITGDGKVVLEDSADQTTPVDLPLRDILGELPQKTFTSKRLERKLPSLDIPDDLTVDKAFTFVLRQLSVCSKGFLTRKVDRSVTGLVAQQPCVGPMQVPVADVGIKANGYFDLSGIAEAIGEQPLKMLINPQAGTRRTIAEMLTNLAPAVITSLSHLSGRANWMWPAKREGEAPLMYEAAWTLRDLMIALGIAIDGGKDSLSMATEVNGQPVVSPGQLVILGYAPMPDVTKKVTPALEGGTLGYIDIGQGKKRLGGSEFAQALGQLGDESPDIENPNLLISAFEAIQELVKERLISAYHDVSDGGLITTVMEMGLAGNCGLRLDVPRFADEVAWLFSEEAGMVFEYHPRDGRNIHEVLWDHGVPWTKIGESNPSWRRFTVLKPSRTLVDRTLSEMRLLWEETSNAIEMRQSNPKTVEAERRSHMDICSPLHHSRLTFKPSAPAIRDSSSPKVAILREEGTNGDREMTAAFMTAGCEPRDIKMSDLRDRGVKSLEEFRGLVFPGGFSYADVFGSGKGWAGPIRFDERIREMFDRFYERPDTFSLGVCNGCQLMHQLELLPGQLLHNTSGRFESRYVAVKIGRSPAVLLRDMQDSILGVWEAHGEGRYDREVQNDLVALQYVDSNGSATEQYPYNPNGSPLGIAGVCSPDGRHLAMMPHPERCFRLWQLPWKPKEWHTLQSAPWLKLFQNAYDFCRKG